MIKYIARQKKDPIKGESKFYAQIAPVDPVTLEEIGMKISESCTVTLHDVKAVLSSLQSQIVYALRVGKSVRLGDLGSFRPTLKSQPQETEDKVTGSDVKVVRCRFTTSAWLRSELHVTNPLVKFKSAA